MSLTEQALTFEKHDITAVVCKGVVYFRGSQVTAVLGLVKSAQTIRKSVSAASYVKTWDELCEMASGGVSVNASSKGIGKSTNAPTKGIGEHGGKSPLFVAEAGVYDLIFHSRKPAALRFRRWVVEEVLPEIMRTGSYAQHKQVILQNETDLHYKVIDFIRRKFPEATLVAGLGELQDSDAKRIDAWRKGYTKGQVDMILMNRTSKAAGLAMELKTPKCDREPSKEQEMFLQKLRLAKFETLVSNDYDDIIEKIIEYRDSTRRTKASRLVRSVFAPPPVQQ